MAVRAAWPVSLMSVVPSLLTAPCIVPTVENGRLTNDSKAGTLVPHGSVIRVVCNKTYEPSFTSVPSACYNGTWTHYPHCEPGKD